MARDLAISNSRLLVMFDREYRIRDIYFPHVGKENHGTGHEFRFGVWVGGQFSWMGKEWAPEMRYGDSSMDHNTGLPLPSYDLWEERWGVHTFTVAAVIVGLRAASRLATEFGETGRSGRYLAAAERMLEGARAVLWSEEEQRFARMATPGPSGYALDMTADASVFGLALLGALPADDPQVVSTLQQVENRLWVQTDVGGMARYENDYYHQVEKKDTTRVPGNPWFICTLWLARYRLQLARTQADLAPGLKLLEWAAERAFLSGTMAEQLHPYTGEPLSVSPLTWSHAEYVRTVQEYVERHAQANLCSACGQTMHAPARRSDRQTVMVQA